MAVDPVTTVANDLLECLREHISRVPDPPAQVCLRAGDIASILMGTGTDECCEGLAWVRVAQQVPTSGSGTTEPAAAGPDYPPYLAVVLEMGVARCAPVGDENAPPTCAEWTETATDVLADAAAMRHAVACCFAGLDPDTDFTVGAWVPMTVEGGCTGGLMTVTVFLQTDCCPPESP